jgi:hypothetical protein
VVVAFQRPAEQQIHPVLHPIGITIYTQSSVLRNVNLRNHWWGGARKGINQKGSEPGNAIISGDSPLKSTARRSWHYA